MRLLCHRRAPAGSGRASTAAYNARRMSIWYLPVSLEALLAQGRHTLIEQLGIEVTAVGEDWLAGTMPVDARTVQPFGLLHGGASVALAESLGSYAGNLCVDFTKFRCVGQEINANHVRPVTSGLVTGTARPVHLGARSQVWQIEIVNPAGQLVCISRLTMAVIPVAAPVPGAAG